MLKTTKNMIKRCKGKWIKKCIDYKVNNVCTKTETVMHKNKQSFFLKKTRGLHCKSQLTMIEGLNNLRSKR